MRLRKASSSHRKRALLTESELFSSALHKPFTRSSQMLYTQFTGSYEPVRLTLGTFVVFRPNVPCGAADVTNVSRDITRPTLLELGSQYDRASARQLRPRGLPPLRYSIVQLPSRRMTMASRQNLKPCLVKVRSD